MNICIKKCVIKRIIIGDMVKRFNILIIILCSAMSIILIRLFFIQVVDNKKYLDEKDILTEKIFTGGTAPRGRIYDRNGVLVVDNKPKKVIFYKKNSNITLNQELEVVKNLAEMLEVDYRKITIKNKKDYYLELYNPDLIKEEEMKDYKNRVISDKDILELKYSRITNEDLEKINDEEAYIYFLMHNGYYYTNKVIKDENVTDYEYALIAENLSLLPGVSVMLDWEREYLYGETFKSILGRVGEITSENSEYYLNDGYDRDDIVGISYLEYQYDSYLKGTKNMYLLKNNSDIYLLEEGKKGNDLYLTIDINFQREVDNIIIESLKSAKSEPNTNFLNKSFVIVSNPISGEIYAMSGKQIINGKVYDYTPGVITTSYVVGSTVKGASHIVGYNTGALKIGEVREDSCIKIKATNEKCSWKYLGLLDDITALKYSSNTYLENNPQSKMVIKSHHYYIYSLC